MTFAVVYSKDAVEDIEAAFDWLSSRAPGAAVDLLRTIARTETHLERNPATIVLFEPRRLATYAVSICGLSAINCTFKFLSRKSW
jgi:plasmid stabilization system protein ParE